MANIPRKDMAKHEQVECQAFGCDHAEVKIQLFALSRTFRFQWNKRIQLSHIIDLP